MTRNHTEIARRTLRVVSAGVVLAAVVAQAAAAPSSSSLFLTAAADCRPPGSEELACGAAGTFFVAGGPATPAKSGCALIDAAGGAGLYPRTGAARAQAAWSPCHGGSCFSAEPRGPWVAVVDWDDAHGWSVGETIRQASGHAVEARLYRLDASGLAAVDALPAVADVHVLAQLCRIAEDARTDSLLAVNMSFGRLADRSPAPCEPRTGGVACVLGEVIAGLRGQGVAVFAAAGHEGQLLYPAADPGVLAIGQVDLGHLRATGASRPLPQTPAGVAGLFPGHGLYLEVGGAAEFWPAPPGSSYASALAAGWWAGYRVRAPKLTRKLLGLCGGELGLLAPLLHAGSAYLGCGSVAFPRSDLAPPGALLATALGERPEVCDRSDDDVRRRAGLLRIEVDGPAAPVPELTLAELQVDLSRPAPDSRPCVPCHDGGDDDDDPENPYGDDDPTLTLPESESGRELVIDMASSQALPREHELTGLYLQVGTALYRFSDSEQPALLGDLALGRVGRLTVGNAPSEVDEEPVSLVYALRLAGDGRVFRSSTPVLVHDHR